MKNDNNIRNGFGSHSNQENRLNDKAAEEDGNYNPFTEPIATASAGGGDLTDEQKEALAEMAAKFVGRSLVEFAEAKIDDTKTLLGDRFLCVGGGLLIVAPTGVGKSTTGTDMTSNWSCGKEAFGIRPAKPLKILIVQAENDDGDMTEMTRDVIRQLSEKDRELVRRNTLCVSINNLSAFNFIFVLNLLLKQHRPDLVLIDPFNAFSGGDPSNPTVVSTFLRNWLNPLLTQYQCGAMIIHHTPKTRNWDTSKWKPADWAYAAAGNNDMSNWARAIMVLDATNDPDVYRFVMAKRGKRAGWKDEFGTPVYERYFTRSQHGVLWSEATEEQLLELELAAEEKKKKQGRKPKYPDNTLLKPLLENENGLAFNTLLDNLTKSGCPISKSTLWDRWEKWKGDGVIESIADDLFILSESGSASLRQKNRQLPNWKGEE